MTEANRYLSPDLIIRGGRIYDPGTDLDQVADIAIRSGKIAEIGQSLEGEQPIMTYPPHLGTAEIDASGCMVVPGFIDLHAHVYTGVCPLTVDADDLARVSGVTTMVSAGDAGANTIDGFRYLAVERNRTRVLAFLHISTIGLASWPVGEAVQMDMLDVDLAERVVADNRDLIVGIKVRETAPDVVGDNGLEPLRRAIELGKRTSLPVMCHIGNTPTSVSDVLKLLRPGDILTHCFTGSANNLIEDSQVVDGAREALDRGVVFDIAHGFGSFDFQIAEAAFAEGISPTTISTDAHSFSVDSTMQDLPLTMSKCLALGMSLADVILAVTARPAAVLGLDDGTGSVRVGGVADLALVRVESSTEVVNDAFGNTRALDQRIRAVETVRAGRPWGRPFGHPGADPHRPFDARRGSVA